MYPNKKQEIKLNRTLAICRHLYNDALEERKRQAELNRLCAEFQVFPWGKPEWITYEDQANDLSESKTPEHPRFKGRNRYNTFTYPQSGFEINGGRIKLSKIGNIRIFQHREIEGKIKTCTIKKDVDQWYVVITVDMEDKEPVPVETIAGIDMGLKSLITLNNGDQIEPQKFLRKSEEKLAWEQIKLSRKKKGSANRKKQITKVGRVHRKIRKQREDFAHKTSRTLVNTYDMIAFENLNIQGMVQNHNLAKSISDASWYQLQIFTKYKIQKIEMLTERN